MVTAIHTYIDRNSDAIDVVKQIKKLPIYSVENPYKLADDKAINNFIDNYDNSVCEYIAISVFRSKTVSGFEKYKILLFFLTYCDDYPDYGDKYYYSMSFIDPSKSVYLKPKDFYDEIVRL